MRPTDIRPLDEGLQALAEVFGAKAPTAKAVAAWCDVLRDFPIDRVSGLLRSWPKMHSKMPTPRDVWVVLNEQRSETIEKTNEAEKATQAREVRAMGDPRVRDENMKRIRDMIAQARSATSRPADLARSMLDAAADGKALGSVQREFIVHHLGWTQEQIDDIERSAVVRTLRQAGRTS